VSEILKPPRSAGVRCCSCILILLLSIGAPGCMKSSGAVSVQGRVTYRGNALKSARITFFPDTGRPVSAVISDAEYTTELRPGDYAVAVNVGTELPAGFKEGDPVPAPKIVLPPQYSTRAQSTLKATVKTGQSEPIDFELK
jgi:hypothetical protein